MYGAQQVYIGTGHAAGKGKSMSAACLAITNPLMAMPISEALKALIIITVSLDGDLDDVGEAVELIANAVHPDSAIIFGAFFEEEIEPEAHTSMGFSGLYYPKGITCGVSKGSVTVIS